MKKKVHDVCENDTATNNVVLMCRKFTENLVKKGKNNWFSLTIIC